jgi:hypothetical protein
MSHMGQTGDVTLMLIWQTYGRSNICSTEFSNCTLLNGNQRCVSLALRQ